MCTKCGQELQIGDYPFCPHGRSFGGNRLSAIHTSERTVIYRNPRTGEVRYPARADVAVPGVYVRQGYERQELRSAAEIRSFEKSSGRLHERSWYDPGSATAERDLLRHDHTPNTASLDDPSH